MLPSEFDRRRIIAIAGGFVGAALAGAGSTSARQPATPAAGTPNAATPGPDDVLITALDLATALASSMPPVVVALTEPESWLAGHIPGSRQIDWPEVKLDETTPEAITAWSAAVRPMLTSLGIMPSSDVVIYDGGSLFAARLWWILDYLGHDRKRVLDGGLPAWVEMDGTTESGDPTDSPATPGAGPYPDTTVNPDRLATKDEILSVLGAPAVVLVDARQADEYDAGHIPGAVNINYPMNARMDDPKTFLSPDDLVALYAAAGVTPDRRVIPYCSTGVRSAVTYQALRLAGFPDVGLYSGSWSEWSADPETPREQS